MTDAGYVFFGYGVTAVALIGYTWHLLRRERRLRRGEDRWR